MEKQVRYGQSWSTALLTEEEKATVFANRSGYTFLGYHTMPNGQGTQYIDRYGKVVRDWLEDGYEFNGSTYEVEGNFDNTTSTFTLYANWLYNRADVTVKFKPEVISKEDNNHNISHVITNLASLSSWVSQDDKWYAEIVIGATLQIKAIEFEGYKFMGWTLSFEGGEAVEKPSSFNISSLEMGSYVLTAIYQPTFKLSVINENNGRKDGGAIDLLQDGNVVTGSSFDSAKKVSLRATPAEGYRFLYFVDNNTGDKLYAQIGSNGVATYTYSSLQDKPIDISAVFTGKTIVISLDSLEIQRYHQLVYVKINDRQVDYNSLIYAKVGDSIKVSITKSKGYGIEASGARFNYTIENGNYLFSYSFKLEDLTVVDSSSYGINLKFSAPKEEIRFTFAINVNEAYDEKELANAGYFTLKYADGEESNVEIGAFYTVLFGDTVVLNINKGTNYILTYAYLSTTEMTYGINDKVKNYSITINEELMEEYFDYQIKITAVFERLIWTDVRSSAFEGKGEKKNPYLISNAQDFALLSYFVNNGERNEKGKLYSQCYYKVTKNIDFSGRFFEPIGTKENPFNGTIIIGKHKFTNVLHYRDYTNPRPSYSGLFWHLGKKAKIIQSQKSIWLVILIVVGNVIITAVVIMALLLNRRRRRKRLDELANEHDAK